VDELERALGLARRHATRIYEEGRAPPSHRLDHVLRVIKLSRYLAEELGLGEEERKLLEIAAWLHDVALAATGSKEGHAARSAEMAEELLEGLLDEREVRLVVDAVREHSWRGDRRPTSHISEILQDADRLDALGAVGIYRAFAYGVHAGREFCDLEDPLAERREPDESRYTLDHFFTKLLRLGEYMNTEPARREAERRIEFMRLYLEELKREALLA